MSQTRLDCHRCRSIDPPWHHHPWPFGRQSYGSLMGRVWVCFFLGSWEPQIPSSACLRSVRVDRQVCAQRGYNFVCTMAASFSVERRKAWVCFDHVHATVGALFRATSCQGVVEPVTRYTCLGNMSSLAPVFRKFHISFGGLVVPTSAANHYHYRLTRCKMFFPAFKPNSLVLLKISKYSNSTQTLHGTAIYDICRSIDPPNHHPWPFLGSPIAVPWVASGIVTV